MSTSAGARVRHGLQQNNQRTWVERLGRAGLASRGFVYLVVAFLALRMTFGERQQETDRQGALQAIARQPFGHALLVALAIGFLGYAAWRIYSAVTNPGGDEDLKGWAKRAAEIGRGLLYLAFALSTAQLALFDKAKNGGQQQATWTARLLKLPLGKPLVVAVGLVVIVSGIASAWRGLARKFDKHLKQWEIPDGLDDVIQTAGVVGFTGRGVAFCLVGGFLVQAALHFDPNRARGLDGALHDLVGHSYGGLVLVVVALGLLAFGAYSCAEARYRRILGS